MLIYYCNVKFCLQSLKKIGHDRLILMLSVTVFLSYLPEAGEYSSFFVYLQLVSTSILHVQKCNWKHCVELLV